MSQPEAGPPASYLPRIRARVLIHAHRRVVGLLDGEYASLHLGRSMDLHDLREYVRGDEVKDIDWKATARSGQVLVKRFTATRQHLIVLVVSTGRSMAAQAGPRSTKRDLSVTVSGLLGWLALRHGDRVSVMYGDAAGCRTAPTAETEAALDHALSAVHDAITPTSAEADLAALLRQVTTTLRRRSIVVLVADDPAIDEGVAALLHRVALQHEVMVATIDDLDPTSDPATLGGRPLVEVGQRIELPDWARRDRRLAQEYAALRAAEEERVGRLLDRLGIAHQSIGEEGAVVTGVLRLLHRHRHAHR
ncbi:MAG: DUF58 domain-containing protein [Nocardioides sp.]|uniref:DUF58 domain-containing protein n=1 Tax=Nocardioides sp. TaxID=35761 RepID=UPI0039E331E3